MGTRLTITLGAALALLTCGACGGDGGGGDSGADAGGREDAAAACEDSLDIGRCALADGSSCTATTEDAHFEPVADGGEVPLVIGFQGSLMIPLALRARGIDPGAEDDPSEQPEIDAQLYDGSSQVTSYMLPVPFSPVADQPDTFEWLYVFLIIPGASEEVAGTSFSASIEVTDPGGEHRCGEKSVVAAPMR